MIQNYTLEVRIEGNQRWHQIIISAEDGREMEKLQERLDVIDKHTTVAEIRLTDDARELLREKGYNA